MKTKIFLGIAFFFSSYSSAQTDIIFNYDEAGNQIYRGISNHTNKKAIPRSNSFWGQSSNSLEEQNTKFWKNVTLYPVPVKNILTIEWNQEINPLIESISLYEHSRLSQIFIQKNASTLNNRLEINMQNYYIGVYVLSFHLKDGKVISKNIIKE